MDNKILNALGLSHLISIIKTALNGKQDSLTAGSGISINENVISATSAERRIFVQTTTTIPSDMKDGDILIVYED